MSDIVNGKRSATEAMNLESSTSNAHLEKAVVDAVISALREARKPKTRTEWLWVEPSGEDNPRTIWHCGDYPLDKRYLWVKTEIRREGRI